ncbi:mannose-6-phosphate receptor binding protein 1 [Lates japonicus]|uniref:Mannose-6-phosphate receptor binding protein 1 n=1 Tax=Lates japonicus TaxID=270547 RepID=A0AAD3MW93_LATJO|nr:mannose-6-phosphate receptor binding protein 1 [Lates japonicus]
MNLPSTSGGRSTQLQGPVERKGTLSEAGTGFIDQRYTAGRGGTEEQQAASERLNPAVTMADSGKTNESGAAAAEQANGDQQNVVSRVSNLPLVSSACEVVSSAYSSTKDNVPLLKGVMDVAESGVRTLGAAATTGSKPLLDIIEPQLATVNEYALKGLDKMEEKLPILHQPADKSVAGRQRRLWWGAVMGGVELTRQQLVWRYQYRAMGTRMGQMLAVDGTGPQPDPRLLTRTHRLPRGELL